MDEHKESEDIGRLFVEDIADKKRTGRGSFGRVRGGGKYVKLPFESLQGKAKRDYTKASEVRTYRMVETMTYEKLKELPKDEARKHFSELVKQYPNKEIAKKLGTSEYRVYLLQGELNVYRRNVSKSLGVVPQSRPRLSNQSPLNATLNLGGSGEELDQQLSAIGALLNAKRQYKIRLVVEETV